MTAKTDAERKAAERQRKAASGLKRMTDLWAHPQDVAAIKAYAENLRAAREANMLTR